MKATRRYLLVNYLTLSLLLFFACTVNASQINIEKLLLSRGVHNVNVTILNNSVQVYYSANNSTFTTIREEVRKISKIGKLVLTHVPDKSLVEIRKIFNNGQIISFKIPASCLEAFLDDRISLYDFIGKIDITPLTRGLFIMSEKCFPQQGLNCSNCQECRCYPNEKCSPNSKNADYRGCTVIDIPSNAELIGAEYICKNGYVWNRQLTDCITDIAQNANKVKRTCNQKRNKYISFADAYVYAYSYRNWNRSNRGKYDQLLAGWHPTGGESRVYIKFDLSHIDPAKVNKAILRLFHFQTAGGNGVDLGIYRVASPWKEGTDTYHPGYTEQIAAPGDISWVQQPTIAPVPIATFNPGTGLYDWSEVNITPLVKKWLSGTPNYGLVIKPMNHRQESVYYFASRERNPGLDKPKGKSKAPVLMVSGTTSVNNGITQPPRQISNADAFQHALGKPCAPDKEFVRSLFQSVLERDLDVSFTPGHGVAHLRSLQNGASREAVTRAFFNSPEYKNKQKSNQDFIRDAYQAVLGREPNTAELRRRIGINRNDFIATLFNSTEYRNITAGCLHNNGGNSINSGMTPLPFFEDFSQGASRWSYPGNAATKQGKMFWNVGTDFKALRLNSSIPMEDIIIEFDGYAETNGFTVHLVTKNNAGYTVIFGGWFNTRSGSDIGKAGENRKLVAGKVWRPRQWSHYKIVRSGTRLAGYCDGRLLFERTAAKRYNGPGKLFFDSWNALIGVDNIRIYRAKKSASKNTIGPLVSGSYQVDHRVGGKTWHSTWALHVVNDKIVGTSEWSCCPGHRVDQMNGEISGNAVLIARDCSQQGYNGPCKQIFKGKIQNGHIEGSATGTGLGSDNHWILYLNNQP